MIADLRDDYLFVLGFIMMDFYDNGFFLKQKSYFKTSTVQRIVQLEHLKALCKLSLVIIDSWAGLWYIRTNVGKNVTKKK